MNNNQQTNYERFPNNVFEPKKLILKSYNSWTEEYYDEICTLYLARFNNLHSLYQYLKSNPQINTKVFTEEDSINGERAFSGKPYEEALEDLIKKDYEPKYEEFLKLQRNLDNCNKIQVHKYETVRTLAGGHLNIPAYSAGNPLCYESEQRILQSKFIRIHVVLNYLGSTTENQIFNRAIIITNILKAIENAGYSIDLNTFALSRESNEFIHTVIKIKNYGENLNLTSLYKTLCHVEFFRRIIFRVRETMDVQNHCWGNSYGRTCDEETIREVLKLNNNDIIFLQPKELGIIGNDLAEDFENAVNTLNLSDKIDVEKAKKQFRENVKKLTLNRS